MKLFDLLGHIFDVVIDETQILLSLLQSSLVDLCIFCLILHLCFKIELLLRKAINFKFNLVQISKKFAFIGQMLLES